MLQSVPPRQYTRRLQRLLAIINEIKTNPQQAPEALYTSLDISCPMFYKDSQVLKALSFAFHHDRHQHRYIITQDRFLPVLDLSITEMLALIMAAHTRGIAAAVCRYACAMLLVWPGAARWAPVSDNHSLL